MAKHETKKPVTGVAAEGQRLGGPGSARKHSGGKTKANPNKKAMKRLMARRSDYDKNPPLMARYSSIVGAQQHGLNRKGNMAKRPGSMKA